MSSSESRGPETHDVSVQSSVPSQPADQDESEEKPLPSTAAMRSTLADYKYDIPSPVTASTGTVGKEKAARTSVSTRSMSQVGLKRFFSADLQRSASRGPKKPRTTSGTAVTQAVAGEAKINNLVDSLRPGLTLVFIGLNPGIRTAETGHAYAHPSNLFWSMLHESGITPKRHAPADTHALPDLYSIGNTNICARPTKSEAGLNKQELQEGAMILEEKIRSIKPKAVAIVGKSIWLAIYKAKTGKVCGKADFKYGWQSEELQLGRTKDDHGRLEWSGAKTFVATTTSGLAAGMSLAEKQAIWKPLGDWVAASRNGGSLDHREPSENMQTQ